MDDIRVKTPGPHFCHFPLRDDYGPAYFAGLMSERLEHDPKKKNPWTWKKLPGHERNEALGLPQLCYGRAFKVLPADLDAIDARLKAARGQVPRRSTPAPAPKRAAEQTRRGAALDKYYDDCEVIDLASREVLIERRKYYSQLVRKLQDAILKLLTAA